jgi:hypothetical protein
MIRVDQPNGDSLMIDAIRRFFARPAEQSVLKNKKSRYENIAAFAFCMLVSAVFLGICTRSSPLYPLNDWVDSNCFFTVGKAMFNGKVVYRDIYEQKGILLYFIHGLGYLISNTTFFGVFIFEVVSYAFFLYIAYLIARLYTNYAFSLAILPVISWSVLTSVSLRQGDSAEEFCLPYILFAIYALLKNLRRGDGSGIPDNRTVFVMGACAACVLWIKYTMLGIYIGYVITAVVLCIIDKDLKTLFSAALSFILGALAVSTPFLIYFAVNGALKDLFVTYFYNNMFLYVDERTFTEKLAEIFSLTVRGLSYNKLWGVMAYVGLLSLVVDVREPRASLGGLFMYVGHIFFIYWGGIGWYYYSFGMVSLSVMGFVTLARVAGYVWDKLRELVRILIEHYRKGMTEQKRRELAYIFDKKTVSAVGYICAACLVLSLCTVYADKSLRECPNVFYMEQEREDIWQTKFAKIINESEDRTLLNYSCLDLGLYTTANIVPSEKFFARLNIDLPEMKESLERSVREQHTEFVVVRSAPSQFVLYYYELVASETSHVEYEGSSISYHLLRRKDLSK